MLAGNALPHGSGAARRPSYIVPAASHKTVTSPACAGRLLMTEHQVPRRGCPRWNNYSGDFTSHALDELCRLVAAFAESELDVGHRSLHALGLAVGEDEVAFRVHQVDEL